MVKSEQDQIKKKTWKLFTAAILFALLAGVGTMLYLKFLEQRLKSQLTPPQKEMTHVIVASRDLPVGSVINGSTVSSRTVPRAYVNNDIFTPADFDSIKGAILVKPLKSGKMLAHDYIDLKIPKDFSGTIQEGHRAITIQVDEINSISGMVRPGNVIDLFTKMALPKGMGNGSAISREAIIPVLEDVLVLATDKVSAKPNEDEFKYIKSDPRHRAYNTLTLEVTPREAALIAIAQSKGELITALRNINDTGGILFSKVTLADLIAHSAQMHEAAASKQHNRNLNGIHRNDKGQLVTRDGVVITDPNVHLNKNGLLVTKNGTVLSGRNLMVGTDGRIRTKNGEIVDTASLKSGKNGSLVDKNGTVLASNGYTTTRGGFLVDKNGNVVTPDGHIISGLTVGKDGRVRTSDGRIVTADQITVAKDGKVRINDNPLAAMTVGKDGKLRSADGKLVKAADLVTVDPDGTVRNKDGKILKGVHMGKDGKLYNADGKEMSPADILAATKGFTENRDGTVTDASGKTYTAKDLVRVGKDGVMRTKDGTVLKGVYMDKDGKLHNADGSLLTARDILTQSAIAKAAAEKGTVLKGVTGSYDPAFTKNILEGSTKAPGTFNTYEVEYILGGSSNGPAPTFTIQIDDKAQPVKNK